METGSIPNPKRTPVGGVKGLLNAVAVVDVDVDVEDPGVVLEQLQNGKDDVVDVAETRGLGLLGVVQATGPVDGNVGGPPVELVGATDGASRGNLTESVETVEDGTVYIQVDCGWLAQPRSQAEFGEWQEAEKER